LIDKARIRDVRSVLVGTANSSLSNIAFYQKCGFRIDHVRRDYFSYFAQPVMEDGILIRDMLVFRIEID
jgi:RimJ/RimL family protein N-acetyltransferase